jgi:hypothetical protein
MSEDEFVMFGGHWDYDSSWKVLTLRLDGRALDIDLDNKHGEMIDLMIRSFCSERKENGLD